MKNYIQPGKSITIPAPANTDSGEPIVVGSLKGIASNSAKAGEDLTVDREGVYGVTKATGSAWAIGDKLYYKASTKEFTKTSTGNTLFGFAASVSASGDAVGNICLADAL